MTAAQGFNLASILVISPIDVFPGASFMTGIPLRSDPGTTVVTQFNRCAIDDVIRAISFESFGTATAALRFNFASSFVDVSGASVVAETATSSESDTTVPVTQFDDRTMV